MEIPLQFSLLITICLSIMLVHYIWKGYRNGLILEAIITLSLLFCILIGWYLSSVMKDMFLLIPTSIIDTGVSSLGTIGIEIANRMVWFLVLFVITNIILRFLRKYIRKLNKITIVGSINQIMGSILAFCKGVIYSIIIIVIISSPIFTNGKEALNNAGLLPIREMIKQNVPIAKDILSVFDVIDSTKENGNVDWKQMLDE